MWVRGGIAALALGLLVVTPAAAQQSASLYGPGAASCSEFTAGYRDPQMELNYLNWAKGMWSGLNIAVIERDGVYRDLASLSADTQKNILRTFCAMHPTAEFAFAAAEVYMRFREVKYDAGRGQPGFGIGRPLPQPGQSAPGR
jgi:hypothetical protein